MKVSELTGAQLDYWVAKAEGLFADSGAEQDDAIQANIATGEWRPSAKWEHGGPIIERERIGLEPMENGKWFTSVRPEYSGAERTEAAAYGYGPVPLVSAMRAYVASKFGEEIPDA